MKQIQISGGGLVDMSDPIDRSKFFSALLGAGIQVRLSFIRQELNGYIHRVYSVTPGGPTCVSEGLRHRNDTETTVIYVEEIPRPDLRTVLRRKGWSKRQRLYIQRALRKAKRLGIDQKTGDNTI